MASKRYSIDDIRKAVAVSASVSQVVKELGLSVAGGNIYTISKRIKENNIDTSHFLGQAINRGKKFGDKNSLDFYLTERTYISSDYLKKRLIRESVFEKKCMFCGLKKWQGKDIPLELHHVNSDRMDNSLENIVILCPNCHALEHKK